MWRLVARQFRSPLIYLLCVAAGLAWLGGQAVDGLFIVVVLILNAAIGTLQEGQAERKSLALAKLIQTRSAVWRQKRLVNIPSEEIVPGDLLWLESGDRIPADLRLIQAHGLEVDESSHTGESLPVFKDAARMETCAKDCPIPTNMAFAGTLVVRGRAKALVIATGSATEIGRMATGMHQASSFASSSVLRLARFTRRLAVLVVLVGATIFGLGVMLRGEDWQGMAFYAVALTVSIVPEGLPIALSVALAVAATELAQRGAILRRLPALESLGSATLLMMDKTGTLTENRIAVHRILCAGGNTYELDAAAQANGPTGVWRLSRTMESDFPDTTADVDSHVSTDASLRMLLEAAVLCNEATLVSSSLGIETTGDPTDIAILSAAATLGVHRAQVLSRWPQTNQIPFEPEHRYAATFHRNDEGTSRVVVKGAPERVFQMSETTGEFPTDVPVDAWQRIAARWAQEGDRVLALGQRLPTASTPDEEAAQEPTNLVILGLLGLRDTLRPEAKRALEALQASGIRVIMVTGDHPATAFSVAKELGIASHRNEVFFGRDVVDKSQTDAHSVLDTLRVCARTSPEEKRCIVQLAKAAGHTVAVTGDGVNDAPALRAADVGISMGKIGTDVAREAADLVLSDDNLLTLVDGVRCGRGADDNIRKVLFLLVSTGAAEFCLVLLALLAGLPIPLLPVQLLWLNLVTNGIQDVALAFEAPERNVLQRSPRDVRGALFDAWLFERTMASAIFIGVLGFAVFAWSLHMGLETTTARNLLLLFLVLVENVQACQARSETHAFWRISWKRTQFFVVGVGAALLLHLVALQMPVFQKILGIAPVSGRHFVACAAGAFAVAAFGGFHKWWWRVRNTKTRKSKTPNLNAAR